MTVRQPVSRRQLPSTIKTVTFQFLVNNILRKVRREEHNDIDEVVLLHVYSWYLEVAFCNYQRPVFSLGRSQHMHKITNLRKFKLNYWSSNCEKIVEEKKHPCCTSCVLSDAWFRDLEVSKSISNILVRNLFFLKKYVASEGAVSHNVLYYQQLSITR